MNKQGQCTGRKNQQLNWNLINVFVLYVCVCVMFVIRWRFFWDVTLGNLNRSIPWYCETILGMRELHSIRSKDMGDIFSIETRKYACFCEFCIDANGLGVDHCMNDAYVKQWKYVPLNPKGLHPIPTWKEMHMMRQWFH